MQIINTIEIICGVCGKSMPVDMNVGREDGKYIYQAMPCPCSVEGSVKLGDQVEILTGIFEGHRGTVINLRENSTCDVDDMEQIPLDSVEVLELF